MRSVLLFVITIVLLLSIIGCTDLCPVPDYTISTTSSNVVLEGLDKTHILIDNKNDFPVMLRAVWQFSGERTQWIRILEAKTTINLQHTSRRK